MTQVIGIVVLGLGIWRARVAYRFAADRSGIPVSSAAFMVFCDLILLAGGIFSITLAIDSIWIGLLDRPSLIDLEPDWPWSTPITGLHFVSWPTVVVVLPVLTLWFTSLSSQQIYVDREGVTSFGAAGSTFIAWRELEQVRVRGQRNPLSFTVVDFRRLQRVLDLHGAGRSLTINEASSPARKKAIVQELKAHIPDTKRHLLHGLGSW